MRQYVVDELTFRDYEKIKQGLNLRYGPAALDGVYWVPMPASMLTPIQKAHQSCQPFYMAIVLESTRIIAELLVRTQQRIRCDCMGYATETQRNWFFESIDELLRELEIKA